MFDGVFSFFEKLLYNFTWTRFTFLISVMLLLVGGSVMYEFYTGHFRLARLEREVQLIEKAAELSVKVGQAAQQDTVRVAYSRISARIAAEVAAPPLQIGNLPSLPSRVILAWFLGLRSQD